MNRYSVTKIRNRERPPATPPIVSHLSTSTSFVTRNDDVFLRANTGFGRGVIGSENRSPGDMPVCLDLEYLAKADSTASTSITWHPISEARRERGDVVDFSLSIQRTGTVAQGDLLVVRFPVRPDRFWDPVFASLGAVAFRINRVGAVSGAEIGIGSRGTLRGALGVRLSAVSHQFCFFRFPERPDNPHLELRFHLAADDEGPFEIRIGRLFAGLEYDPYIYNPYFEYSAFLNGRRDFGREAEVKSEFIHRAVELDKVHKFSGAQALIRPFVVMREGEPAFPMLVGTPNSLSWYATDPQHGIEFFHQNKYVNPGDVVFDCGAHAGQMATLFAHVVGPQGSVTAFEPFPQNCLQIEAQAALNELSNLHVVQAAVSSTKSKLSLLTDAQSIANKWQRSRGSSITVDTVVLDDYIGLKPNFIKLDIEGAEVAALRGAQRIIHKYAPQIFIEVHTPMLPDHGETLEDLFKQLPQDVLDVKYQRPDMGGVHTYKPGCEADLKFQFMITAGPRDATGASQ